MCMGARLDRHATMRRAHPRSLVIWTRHDHPPFDGLAFRETMIAGGLRMGSDAPSLRETMYDNCVELEPSLQRKIEGGDPRFVLRLHLAQRILDSRLPPLTAPVNLDDALAPFGLGRGLVEA